MLITWLVRVLRHGEDLESGGWSDSSTGGTPRRRSQLTSLRFGDNPAIVLTGGTLGPTTNIELDDATTRGAQLSSFKRKHDSDPFASTGGPGVTSVTFAPDTKMQESEGHSSGAH